MTLGRLHSPLGPCAGLLLLGVLLLPAPSLAQEDPDGTTAQAWLTYQLYKPEGERNWAFHFEGRSNAPDEPEKWKSLDGRARLDFYPRTWMDVFPESILRYTVENDDLNSLMLNLRGGIRFSLPSTEDLFRRERVPLYRFQAGILLRMEWRQFWYSDSSTDSSWRARARAELQVPINHGSMAVNRTVYLRTDAEVFVPVGSESPETFANRLRLRLGLGYRYNFHWRLELLAIWQQSRDTLESDTEEDEVILNLRLRNYF